MREIRLLTPDDIDAYTDIAYNAYPSFKDLSGAGLAKYKANLRDIIENDPDVFVYGLFEAGEMIAVMRVFVFTMNYCGELIQASGLGYLGVHLLHKKKGAARELVDHYERFSTDRKIRIGLLLPFRPDYYKESGYGFGSKWNEYRLPTDQLPSFRNTGSVEYLSRSNLSPLYDCYERVVRKTHGKLMKIMDERKNLEESESWKIVASFASDGRVNGYLVFEFVNGRERNYTINHMHIKEMEFEDPQAMRTLLEFIHRQRDQAQLVVFGTGEEYFHYLFANPIDDSRNYVSYGNLQTNTQFIGVMYKVFEARKFVEEHPRRFNSAPLAVRFEITDNTRDGERVTEDFVLPLRKGDAGGEPAEHVSLKLDRADFSSLMMGCVDPGGLYKLGRLAIDDPGKIPTLDKAFHCSQKPLCNTNF